MVFANYEFNRRGFMVGIVRTLMLLLFLGNITIDILGMVGVGESFKYKKDYACDIKGLVGTYALIIVLECYTLPLPFLWKGTYNIPPIDWGMFFGQTFLSALALAFLSIYWVISPFLEPFPGSKIPIKQEYNEEYGNCFNYFTREGNQFAFGYYFIMGKILLIDAYFLLLLFPMIIYYRNDILNSIKLCFSCIAESLNLWCGGMCVKIYEQAEGPNNYPNYPVINPRPDRIDENEGRNQGETGGDLENGNRVVEMEEV